MNMLKRRNVGHQNITEIVLNNSNDEKYENDEKSIKPIQTNLLLSNKLNSITFDSIVLSSGGINLFKMLGVLEYLYKKNKLNDIVNFEGCSAGSLLSLLLILDYKPTEAMEYLLEIDSEHIFSSASIETLLTKNAFLNNEILIKHIEKIIINKMGFVPTMIELYELTKKNWTSVSFNYTKYKVEYINHENYPNTSCALIAAASCCIPFVFSNVKIEQDSYIDGAVFDAFPIKHLLSTNPSSNILGIMLSEDLFSNEYVNRRENINHMSFFIDIVSINKRMKSKKLIKLNEKENICIFEIPIINGKEFNFTISYVDKLKSFSEGYSFIKNLVN